MKTLEHILNTAKLIAILSFSIGTCLLLAYLVLPNRNEIMLLGMQYVGYVTLLNMVVLLILLISVVVFWDYRLRIFKTCLLILINIPIAIGYFFIVLNRFNF